MMLLTALLTVTLAQQAPAATSEPPSYTRHVAIVVWDGAEVLDWAGPSEVFQVAGGIARSQGRPAFHVYTVSKSTDPIVSQAFLKVVPQYSIHDAPQPDIVVLPGGGVRGVADDPEFLEWVGGAARGSEVALSVCTGAFLLAQLELLDGRPATTWHGATDSLARDFPAVDVRAGLRYVDSGDIVTTAGVSAGLDGSLHLVARLLGRRVAESTADYMEYRWNPEPHDVKSYAYFNPSLDSRGRALQRVELQRHEQDWLGAIEICRSLLVESEGVEDAEVFFELGQAHDGAGQSAEAADAFTRAAESPQYGQRAHYSAARCFARIGDMDRTLGALRAAVAAGFRAGAYLQQDADFEALHADPRFVALLKEIDAAQ